MRSRNILPLILFTGIPSILPAATITYVGATSGNEVARWRTDSVGKSFDLDGDNVYGSFGATNWRETSVGGQAAGSNVLGFWAGNAGSQHVKGVYDDIDSLLSANSTVDAGITLNRFTIEFTGVDADYANKIVRIGVMQGVLGAGEIAKDYDKILKVTEVDSAGASIDGGGASGVVSVRGGAADTLNHIDMLFFDISNINAGDRFEIEAPNNPVLPGYNSAFSLDMVAVPEPSTSSLFALAGMSVILRRKR